LDDASTQRPMFVHVLKYNRLEKTLARARRDNEAQALELNQLHARVLAAEQENQDLRLKCAKLERDGSSLPHQPCDTGLPVPALTVQVEPPIWASHASHSPRAAAACAVIPSLNFRGLTSPGSPAKDGHTLQRGSRGAPQVPLMLPSETSTSGRLSPSEAGVRAQSEGTLSNSQKPLVSLQIPTLQFGTTDPSSPLKNGQSMQRSHWTGDEDSMEEALEQDIERLAEEKPLAVQQCAAVFGMYDSNNDGMLNLQELSHALEDLGAGAVGTLGTHEQAVRYLDKDLDGEVDLEEFIEWWFSNK